MLKFNCGNSKGENPMFCKKFAFGGDNVSTDIIIDLEKAPVGMEFKGQKYPAVAYAKNGNGSGCDVRLSIEGKSLTVEFPHTLQIGERTDLEIEFWYEGEGAECLKAASQIHEQGENNGK